FATDVIRDEANPIYPRGGLVALFGNLAPNGAIIKRSAATADLLEHTGRAVVFNNSADMAERLDSDDLDVEANDVLVLRNIGTVGAPGMPEAVYVHLQMKLSRQNGHAMCSITEDHI